VILVPLPSARDDEQTETARALADVGAAVRLSDRELTRSPRRRGPRASGRARRLWTMAEHTRSLATPGAAERLVDRLGLAGRA
jgi:UDP-N-acetylglucosamine:LPS N-acetylglucosamine transferase